MSVDRTAEYRRRAEECRQQAHKAFRDEDKASWLKLAEDWQTLAESTEADARQKQGLISLQGIAVLPQDSN